MKQVTRAGVMVTIIALGAACGGAPGPREAETAAATAVQVGTADTRDLAESIVAGGTVKARTVAVLTSRIVGQVREIAARPGDRVRPGAVLAVLDGREMDAHQDRAEALLTAAAQGQSAAEADKAAAGAALRLASATHARIAQLRDRKSATPQEFDEAEASLSAAQARASAASAAAAAAGANLAGARSAVEAARISAGYSRIAAPFAGTITERHIDEGAMTMPGTPVVTIEQDGGYQVEVRIDETRAARVDWAQAPRVALSSPESDENVFEGRVVERALALDSAHTIVVKVAVPGSNALRTGMFARVSFSGGTRRALSVPADAILQRGQLDAVFVVTDDKARYRVVEVGRQAGDFVEVRAGLAAGERVVRSVPASLVDGATVRTAGSGK